MDGCVCPACQWGSGAPSMAHPSSHLFLQKTDGHDIVRHCVEGNTYSLQNEAWNLFCKYCMFVKKMNPGKGQQTQQIREHHICCLSAVVEAIRSLLEQLRIKDKAAQCFQPMNLWSQNMTPPKNTQDTPCLTLCRPANLKNK